MPLTNYTNKVAKPKKKHVPGSIIRAVRAGKKYTQKQLERIAGGLQPR